MMCRRMGLLLAGVLPALAFAQTPVAPVEVPPTKIRAYFTPGHVGENAITGDRVAAKREIRGQADSLTNRVIVQALADAQQRGVDVILVLDKSNRTQKYSAADYASHAGIPTVIDDRHAIAHNKIMIIDGKVVITGSYNFTRAAEKSNAENIVIIESGAIAEKYLQNWQKHRSHSQPYSPRDRVRDRQ